YAELPVLGFDANTNPWLIFRHWTHPAPMEIYHFYATRLGASGWSTPVQLAHSSGRNTQHAALARAAGGLLQAVYAGDGRSREVRPSSTEQALPYRVYVAPLGTARGGAGSGRQDT